MTSVNVIKSKLDTERNRLYQLAKTPIGDVLFFNLGDTHIQYRNLTNNDWAWSIAPINDFNARHEAQPIETFKSKRLKGFEKAVKLVADTSVYHLAKKKNYDGYIYEIPTTELRAFSQKEYPDKIFAYSRYHVDSLRTIDHLTLERIKTEETIRFNGGFIHSAHTVSAIVDEVYKMLSEKEDA